MLRRAAARIGSLYAAKGVSTGTALLSIVNDATVVTSGEGVSLRHLAGLCQCCAEAVRVTNYQHLVDIANLV